MNVGSFCNWTQSGKGSMLCAGIATIGGLHLLLTPSQPLLNFLPTFDFTIMGKSIGAQQVVGLALTACGVCALGACCL
jgi:hypothetical protein